MGLSQSQQQLSPHSKAMRSKLPERSAYGKALRIALYQHDRFALQKLTGYDPAARQTDPRYRITAANATPEFLRNRFVDLDPNFVAENISIECYVELIEKRWDAETVRLFLYVGPKADVISTLLATCVIRNHYPALNDVIRTLNKAIYDERGISLPRAIAKNFNDDFVPRVPLDFVKEKNLHHLFPIVCHQNEEGILMTFVEAGLYDPHNAEASGAALRIVAAASMRMHARALQRYGNAILSPMPPMNTTTTPSPADPANPHNAPSWFVDLLKATAAATNQLQGEGEVTDRVVGDGVTAAPIGVHGNGGSSSSTSSTTDMCDLSDDELAAPLLDPSTNTFITVLDTVAPFVAPLIFILSTHQYPSRAVIDSIKAEALRTAVIKVKGSRELPAWQIYKKQQEVIAAAAKKKKQERDGGGGGGSASSKENLEITMLPLLPPVASILALADGQWTPDTHRMHTPSFRKSVRVIYHALTKKGLLNEDDVMGVLAYLPESDNGEGCGEAKTDKQKSSQKIDEAAHRANGDGMFESANVIPSP